MSNRRGRPKWEYRPPLPVMAAARAAAAVYERRRTCRPEDPDLDRFPDQGDLFGVLGYIGQRRRVPPEVLAADALDELVIIAYLREELDRRELGAIRLARANGHTWPGIAVATGLRSGPGAQQRMRRLESRYEQRGPRSEVAAVAATRAAAQEREATRRTSARLRAVLRGLYAQRHHLSEDLAEDVGNLSHELAPARADTSLSAGFVTSLRMLLMDVRRSSAYAVAEIRAAVDEGERVLLSSSAPSG